MNTLDITSAYLGGTQATGLYFGDVKVWPQSAPAPVGYLYDNIIETSYVGNDQASIESWLSGETITGFQQIPTDDPLRVSMSFASSTNYIIPGTSANIPPAGAKRIILPNAISTANNFSGFATFAYFTFPNTSAAEYISLPNATSIGAYTFNYLGNLKVLDIPKAKTLPSTNPIAFQNYLGISGSLTINSGVTASSNWVINRNQFNSRGWTINYVNG